MKSLFRYLLVCLLFYSCSEKEKINQPNFIVSESIITPTVIDGTLSFKTSKEFYESINRLSKLSVSERKNWEEKIGFYSIQRRTEEALDAINAINLTESENEYYDCLKKYADVIELIDHSIERKFKSSIYETICNLNGLFITSDYIQRVTPKTIEVYNLDKLENLNQGLSIKPIRTFENYEKELFSSKRVPTDLSGEYYDNPSGCKHDRRVYVSAISRKVYATWTTTDIYGHPFSYTEYSPLVQLRVWGTMRNWLCNWSEYKTTYAYRNISFCVDGFYNSEELHFIIGPVPYAHSTSSTIMPFTVTMPDFTTPNDDTYGIRETLYPGYRALNEGQRAEQLEVGFYSCHLEGSSRGIILYVNWAVINY